MTDLEAIDPDGTTGTTVGFHPDPAYCASGSLTADVQSFLTFPHLDSAVATR